MTFYCFKIETLNERVFGCYHNAEMRDDYLKRHLEFYHSHILDYYIGEVEKEWIWEDAMHEIMKPDWGGKSMLGEPQS